MEDESSYYCVAGLVVPGHQLACGWSIDGRSLGGGEEECLDGGEEEESRDEEQVH